MIKINDSTYVIIGTLALLVGGTLVFNVGPPTTTIQHLTYWVGIFLVVGGVLLDAGVVVKTGQRIEHEKLESVIRDLENQIKIKQLEIRIKELEYNNWKNNQQ